MDPPEFFLTLIHSPFDGEEKMILQEQTDLELVMHSGWKKKWWQTYPVYFHRNPAHDPDLPVA